MGEVYFYHLTETPLEATLPTLLGKALDAGWRVALRGRDPAQMDRLDRQLWLGPEDSFLPHGLAGGPQDALQPILLLTEGQGAANDPTCLVSVDGAVLTAEDVQGAARAMVIFDGGDGAAVSTARNQWRVLTDAGCGAQYWAQDNGRWVKKAEKTA